jgi:ArsR family transcriptional regulator
MELVQIYECFCDATRLRILHLLTHGPLCVCHFQKILKVPQVKVSQHLAYLRKRGMVEARRHANWMIYSLPENPPRELEANLACLQDCVREDRRFQADRKALGKLQSSCAWIEDALENSCACR